MCLQTLFEINPVLLTRWLMPSLATRTGQQRISCCTAQPVTHVLRVHETAASLQYTHAVIICLGHHLQVLISSLLVHCRSPYHGAQLEHGSRQVLNAPSVLVRTLAFIHVDLQCNVLCRVPDNQHERMHAQRSSKII